MGRKQDKTERAQEAVRGAPLGPVPLRGLKTHEWKWQRGGWPLCDDRPSSKLSQSRWVTKNEGELPVLRGIQVLAGRDVARESGLGLMRPRGAGSPPSPLPPALREGLLRFLNPCMTEPNALHGICEAGSPVSPTASLQPGSR